MGYQARAGRGCFLLRLASVSVVVTVGLLGCAEPNLYVLAQDTPIHQDSAQLGKKERAAQLFKEAEELENQGTPEALKAAIAKYKEALPLWREIGDRDQEAHTLINIGSVYDDIGSKKEAIEFYSQGLSISKATNNQEQQARALNLIGVVFDYAGEKQKALEFYTQALVARRRASDRDGESLVLNNIASIHDELGNKEEALSFYKQAVFAAKNEVDADQASRSANGIGSILYSLGDKKKALLFIKNAFDIARRIDDRSEQFSSIMNVYSNLAEKDLNSESESIAFLKYASTISDEEKNREIKSFSLATLSLFYAAAGEREAALEYLEKYRASNQNINTEPNNPLIFSTTAFVAGLLLGSFGDKNQALEEFRKSLPHIQELNNNTLEAIWESMVGSIYVQLGETNEDIEYGIEYLQQSLPKLDAYEAIASQQIKGIVLTNLGAAYKLKGDNQTALKHLEQAISIFDRYKNHGDQVIIDYKDIAVSLKAILDTEYSNQKLLNNVQNAIRVIERYRTISSSSRTAPISLANQEDIYKLHIDLLMDQYQQRTDRLLGIKAFEASEQSKARSLLDLISEDHTKIRAEVEPILLAQEQKLMLKINALESQKAFLAINTQKISIDQNTLNTRVKNLTEQLNSVRSEIRLRSPHYASLTQPQPLSLKEIQQKVLDYSLGRKRSYLWAVTPTSFNSYELPNQDAITTAAKTLRNLLSDPDASPTAIQEASNALSQLILAPVADKLGQKRLLIVSDGALQYIPFSALTDPNNPQQPLFVEHEIVSTPSASVLAAHRAKLKDRKPATQQIAILADPVFTPEDNRLTATALPLDEEAERAYSTAVKKSLRDTDVILDRLPGTRREAEQILSLVPETSARSALDFTANRATATDPALSQYRIVHFATHGLLNSVNPELSGLVLSLYDANGQPQNGFLRLIDIYNLNLPAELVVLSACQTGLGKEVRGEGIIGLTRGFMYAGAKSVLVSLWNVNDASTSVLMSKFYTKLLQEEMTPAAALRAAQLDLWKSEKWNSPYHWSAFELQGEWQR
jgi:CHAT domain-containing protein